MTDITLHGGVSEIGGNITLIEYKGTRILIDIGMSFEEFGKYYSSYMNPRKFNSIDDLLRLGLLPPIQDIYRRDYLEWEGKSWSSKPGIDAILITHPHLDHMGLLHWIRKDIPIYMSQQCL